VLLEELTRSDSQEIFSLLENPEVHYCIQKSQLPIPILCSQKNPAHNLQLYFFEINFSVILPSTSRYLTLLFPSDQNSVHSSHKQHACYMHCPSNPHSPGCRHFIPLSFKYSPQRPVFKHHQSVFLPLTQQPRFRTNTQEVKLYFRIFLSLHF
jgi:hypothetical protein